MPTNSPSYADEAVPAQRTAASTATRIGAVADHGGLVGGVLLLEQLPARGRDHAGRLALALQDVAGRHGDRDFRARGEDRHRRLAALGGQQLVGALGRQVLRSRVAHAGDLLARQGHHRRRGLALQGDLPAFGGLDRVGRAEDQQVGDGAQRGQVLDRLVGRAVLAQADGVVGHHVDDPGLHQRAQADGRAAVVGEGQEGARIGDDAAVQGHAVHGRGHAELAHAVVDVTAGVVGRVERLHALDEGVVRAGQVGRAADHVGDRRDQLVQGRAGVDAGGVARLGLGGFGDVGVQRLEGVGRQFALHGAGEVVGLVARPSRSRPRPCGPWRRGGRCSCARPWRCRPAR